MKSISTISKSVKYGLYFAASWPGSQFALFHRSCWAIGLGIFQIFQYSYVIAHLKSDTLIDLIDNLSLCMTFTMVGIKLVVAWTYHGVLRDILWTMEEECRKYAVLDTKKFIEKTAQLSYRLTNTVICITLSSTAFYMLGEFTRHRTNITAPRELLLKMDLPFNTQNSPVYELVVGAQYICQASSAYTFAVFTALLLMAVLHVGCQIDIMCRELIEASEKSKKQLKFFVSRHQEIIIFTERIEKLFTYIALCQLVSNTVTTCCLGYLIVIALQAGDGYTLLLKCVVFYVVVCLEAFIYCFAGEYLSTKSKLICDTAYEILWYDINPNDSRLLILVIIRSQKGFTFTFGKFARLSMESFTDIMKASGSYMSVLLAMS